MASDSREGVELTGEDLAKASEVQFIAPQYASSIQISLLVNEFALSFAAPHIGDMRGAGERRSVVMNAPVATLVVSPQTLKDLSILVGNAVRDYEKEWGEIQTAFVRRRAAQNDE